MESNILNWLLENGGYPDSTNRRYKGRDVYEDKIQYKPGEKIPRLFTSIELYSGKVRRKGIITPEKVREEYPLATSVLYVVKSTGEVYKRIKL
jgi:hypothetical protein